MKPVVSIIMGSTSDLPVMEDGGMKLIYVIIDRLITGFRAVVGDDLAGKLFPFFPAAQALQLFDQIFRFFLRDEFG